MRYPIILDKQQNPESAEILLKLFVSKEIIYFEGHFPGHEILPGIVQVDWAISFAQQFFAVTKESFLNIIQLKFTRVILPESTIYLLLNIENNSLSFKYYNNEDVTYSLGKLKIGH